MENLPEQAEPLAKPGEHLAELRKKADFSQKYVADYLRITVNYVNALEHDDYEKLPASPYIIGYLRGYSRLLGIDGDEMVKQYQQCVGEVPSSYKDLPADEAHHKTKAAVHLSESKIKMSSRLSTPKYRKSFPWGWLLIVCAIAIAGFVAFSYYEKAMSASSDDGTTDRGNLQLPMGSSVPMPLPSQAGDQDGDTETQASIDALEDVTDAPESSEAVEETAQEGTESAVEDSPEELPVSQSTAEAPQQNTASFDGDSESALQSQLAQETAEAASTISQMAMADKTFDNLQIRFSKECWLEATDANGDVLAADLYQAGQSVSLQGTAPFSVMLGNARAAQVTLNGEAVTLQPEAGRNALRASIQ